MYEEDRFANLVTYVGHDNLKFIAFDTLSAIIVSFEQSHYRKNQTLKISCISMWRCECLK